MHDGIFLYAQLLICGLIFLISSFPDKQKQAEGNLTGNAIDLVLVVKIGTDLAQNPGVVVVVEVVKVMLDLGRFMKEKRPVVSFHKSLLHLHLNVSISTEIKPFSCIESPKQQHPQEQTEEVAPAVKV